MEQYLKLLRDIKEKGILKPAAREGLPGSLSYFGPEYRVNLSKGFPILTTKKLSFKNIVTELLWFMSGDTNIKYLIDNGCNIWNEDAYNYYVKLCLKYKQPFWSYEVWLWNLKEGKEYPGLHDYTLGDCGKQYGWLWRNWWSGDKMVDQLADLLQGLRANPESRRHLLTSWNPTTLNDMALNACHVLVQFNCRPLTNSQRVSYYHSGKINNSWYDYLGTYHVAVSEIYGYESMNQFPKGEWIIAFEKYIQDVLIPKMDKEGIPKYILDCKMYQRSTDIFLGVPYNLASYALLTHILARMCNMIPGEFIHSFGDAHLYENHFEQADEQLSRTPTALPKLEFDDIFNTTDSIEDFLESVEYCGIDRAFRLIDYNPQPTIKAKLSTGLR